jgi:hypothetical protein
MGFLARSTVAKPYKRCWSQTDAVIAADCDFIE